MKIIINKFKNLFVSYGRRESLNLVARFHQLLKLAGFDAWFDKVNIPDGDDYAKRINHGIESAHNFVYVMAPRCLTSPYCLVELEYARLLGKRVIPINQMVIFDTPKQELSEGDKQVMVGFYKFHNLPDQNIQTTGDVLKRSHDLLEKRDWLDAKEKVSDDDCQRLFDWAQGYENNWAKHDNLDELKSIKLPVFGKAIDTLDSVAERLMAVLDRQADYVHRHTEILANALHWQKNQKATQHLLVGKERTEAEEWLLTEFSADKQPPCLPSALVCEFICEARKNAENMMTDIFICYDVEHDREIRDSVIQSLSRYAKTTWTHDKDIQKGAGYERAIEMGIENSDNFFYFISPHSIASKYCQRELEHALKYNKRIVPLLIAETKETDTPKVLRELQYVDFTDNTCQADYDSDIDDILNILRHDHEYYEQHKMLLARALKWESENHKPSFLLRGHNLDNAKTWLRLSEKREQHSPLALHKELITASEAAKGQLGTEVFISYSRKDGDIARQLNTALQQAGKTTWFDQESISTGVDFEKEIFKGIDGSDNFLIVLSPDAVESEYCESEVNYANEQNKRVITVLYRKVDPAKMPKSLRVINWIDFKDTPFDKSFPELIQAIELDREHAHQHTILQQRASDWAENNRSGDFLLNITACDNAESWQNIALEGEKQPTPTSLQQEFIGKSRRAIQKANRRRNIFFSFVGVLAILAVISAIFSVFKMNEAEQAKTDALAQKNLAEQAKTDALTQKKRAETALISAKESEKQALLAKQEATTERDKAKDAQAEAETQRKKAELFYKEIFKTTELTKEEAKKIAQRFVEKEGTVFRDPFLKGGSKGPEMVWLPADKFRMGGIFGGGNKNERPVHNVSIKRFAIGRYEVTVGEFRQFVEATGHETEAERKEGCDVYKEDRWQYVKDASWRNPYFGQAQADEQPVVCVSWNDVIAYTHWLSEQTGKTYRLPSEAQWEYAARAGKEMPYWWGKEIGEGWANCNGCGKGENKQMAPVNSFPPNPFPPNPFGLYHITGNVEEWIADPYDNYKEVSNDGQIWEEGNALCPRASRGGAWSNRAINVRLAYRNLFGSSLDYSSSSRGFRVARLEIEKSLTKAEKNPTNKAKLLCQSVEEEKIFHHHLRDGGTGPEMVWIPAGTFKMGDIQAGGDSDEKPVHEVSVERFAMGRYEVTFAEYDKFAETTGKSKPSDAGWGRGNRPVIKVSWHDAMAYTQWLTEQTGKHYDLPSEAEWEYAARAGTETKYWWGNEIGNNRANCDNDYCGDTFEYTSPVGSFSANPFGLYDTVGNVWEWVADSWHKNYTNAPNDGRIWSEGADKRYRVLRGGSWDNYSTHSRAAYRSRYDPDDRYSSRGFRVVRRVVARIP
ncbi:SUMF1/EgtB/PvdO family nonheme iron enzyme [Candidatus Parabeggiatoa sp. HSG14]|uniref:SUMF1/EgtB/PvdO family nonheme iron enzyme n=1 Tax=Candidatus Parabeggiatoa sp. HSG14 TaxID=3055593 RepID=UPI0025A70EF4|nr:SUMF1/EgtB/PvdO family nonheme iron enzyme [Thiotrichales bacterium HSG14]